MQDNKKMLNRMVALAMLTALQLVLSRFLSIETPLVKIGFGFVPVMLAGNMFGILGGLIVGGLSDLIGAILFPFGTYFPGYTLTAALSGAVYGLMLKGRPGLLRIFFAYFITTVVVTLGLNTLFTAQLYMEAELSLKLRYLAYLPTRLVQAEIMFVIQVALTYVLLNRMNLGQRIQNAVKS